jgi:hypothetical protein
MANTVADRSHSDLQSSGQEPKTLVPYPVEMAERIAHIMGPSSAAAHALRELERRRAFGEKAALFLIGKSFVVGPMD